MGNKLLVSPSPHVRSKSSTSLVMLCVIVALLPSCLYGVLNFGIHSLVILLVSTASAVVSELVYELILRKKVTIKDLSAVVTGLLVGMNMPPTIVWWIPALGSVFAIIVVKQLFGGLGRNFMNPALLARCVLVLAFSVQMTAFRPGDGILKQNYLPTPSEVTVSGETEMSQTEADLSTDAVSSASAEGDWEEKTGAADEADAVSGATAESEKETVAADAVSGATAESEKESAAADAVSGANAESEKETASLDAVSKVTPLAYLKKGHTFDLKSLFFGNTLGTIGETSALLLLIGGIFLILAGVIDWIIPVFYIAGFAILVLITAAARGYADPLLFTLEELLAGGLLMGAFFMATDYVSSPYTRKGRIIFALFIGVMTWLYRMFGMYKEGVSNAIILANCLVPLIDRFTSPTAFGIRKKKEGVS